MQSKGRIVRDYYLAGAVTHGDLTLASGFALCLSNFRAGLPGSRLIPMPASGKCHRLLPSAPAGIAHVWLGHGPVPSVGWGWGALAIMITVDFGALVCRRSLCSIPYVHGPGETSVNRGPVPIILLLSRHQRGQGKILVRWGVFFF